MHVILATTALFVAQIAFAQTELADTESVADADTHSMDDTILPVDVRAGGAISMEDKYRSRVESRFKWHALTLWESRYVTEGRDNLSGNSLLSMSSEFSIDEINFFPWLAYSPGADYTEINLNFIYGVTLSDRLSTYFGYSHIRDRYHDIHMDDNEVSLHTVYGLRKNISAFAVIYHSFETDGAFIDAGVNYSVVLNSKTRYSLRTAVGTNAAYVPDGHDGLNNFEVRATASYIPVIKLELYVYAGYNGAINRDAVRYEGDEALVDLFWGGAGFSYLF